MNEPTERSRTSGAHIVNLRNDPELRQRLTRTHRAGHYVRIDRATPWGNPFRIGRDGDRQAVIEKYRQWLWSRIRNAQVDLAELAALHGCTLACWCAPLACHGEVLAAAAAWAHEEMRRKLERAGPGARA